MRRGLALLVFVACAAHAQDSRARRDLLEALLPLPPGGGKLIPFGDTAQASGVPMALGVVETTRAGPEVLEFYARHFDARGWPWTGLKQNLAVVPWPALSATVPEEELQVSVMVLDREGGATVVLAVSDMRAFGRGATGQAADGGFPGPPGIKPSIVEIRGEGGGTAVTFEAPLSPTVLAGFYAARFKEAWRPLGLRAGAQHFELDDAGRRWRVRVQPAGTGSRLSAVGIGGAP